MDRPIRILLLDDHTLFRESLYRLLEDDARFSVVGQSATVDEALSIVVHNIFGENPVDVVLLDYDLGSELGTDILASLATILPRVRVILVTAEISESAAQDAMRAGVADIIFKHSGPQRLVDAIVHSMRDDAADADMLIRELPRSSASRPPSGSDRPLTKRQSTVLRGILDGLPNREIALRMFVSESSVKATVQELFNKAGVRTRSQLVRVAIEKHSSDWIGQDAG